MPDSELLDAALRLALAFRHPVYDCLYLACAQRENVPLLTADASFHQALQTRPDLAAYVRLLGA